MRPTKDNNQLGCPTRVWIPVLWLQTDLLTGRRPGGPVGILLLNERVRWVLSSLQSGILKLYGMKCKTPVRTGEVHGFSLGSGKARFLYQNSSRDTYCVMLKSGTMALFENTHLLYPATQFPTKSCLPIIWYQWCHVTPKPYKRKARTCAASFSSCPSSSTHGQTSELEYQQIISTNYAWKIWQKEPGKGEMLQPGSGIP